MRLRTRNFSSSAPPRGQSSISTWPMARSTYGGPLLLMVSLAYACNFMDRSIVATLAQAIKINLDLTDAQLGLLQGFAYVVLYSIMGVPLARLCERWNRVSILSICLATWATMTMVCGLAQNFVQLFLFRVGVGIGEAGCNPCSHSMIADAYAPNERSRALSIYMLGATFGTMIGAMSAGAIAEHLGWRTAFVLVGAPGILIAVAIKLAVKDPNRTEQPRTSAQIDAARLTKVLIRLVTTPAIIHLVLGFTLASFAAGAIGAFTQPYFIRAFGLSYEQIGFIFGLSGGLASASSLFITGRLTDMATGRSVLWYGWLPALGIAISVPCSVAAYTAGGWLIALIWTFLAGFFLFWFIVPTLSALHKLVGARLVATAMALVLMFQNLAGLGTGPYAIGVLIDAASQHFFSAGDIHGFYASCPGGQAPIGATLQLAASCHTALTRGTRIGLLFVVLIELWACAHYVLAARHVQRELARSDDASHARSANDAL